MKVLVFGSRKWVNQKSVEAELASLPKGTVVVEGACPGADNIAGYVAKKLGFQVRPYPALANGRTWPTAGFLRNQEMLDKEHPSSDGSYIEAALCFHEDPNLGKGSKDMRCRLLKANPPIPLRIISK